MRDSMCVYLCVCAFVMTLERSWDNEHLYSRQIAANTTSSRGQVEYEVFSLEADKRATAIFVICVMPHHCEENLNKCKFV